MHTQAHLCVHIVIVVSLSVGSADHANDLETELELEVIFISHSITKSKRTSSSALHAYCAQAATDESAEVDNAEVSQCPFTRMRT